MERQIFWAGLRKNSVLFSNFEEIFTINKSLKSKKKFYFFIQFFDLSAQNFFWHWKADC